MKHNKRNIIQNIEDKTVITSQLTTHTKTHTAKHYKQYLLFVH